MNQNSSQISEITPKQHVLMEEIDIISTPAAIEIIKLFKFEKKLKN